MAWKHFGRSVDQRWIAALRIALAATLAASATAPSPAAAQPSARTLPPAPVPGTAALLAHADASYFAGRPAEALAEYDGILSRDSTAFDVLWHAARAAIALGFMAPNQSANDPMYLRAEALASAAARVRPDRVEGHFLLAAAQGRRALHADLRTTVRLARSAYESAERALAIDSLHAGAHDVLGKLHSEVRNLPAVYRFIAGRMLGVSVARKTSWDIAERHLARAVALDPAMILYRLDLGELYLRMGRKADAARVLGEAARLPRIHPPDATFQRDALRLLDAATQR